MESNSNFKTTTKGDNMKINLVNESHSLLGKANKLWAAYSSGKMSVERVKLSTSLLNATKGMINTSISAERWYGVKSKPKKKK